LLALLLLYYVGVITLFLELVPFRVVHLGWSMDWGSVFCRMLSDIDGIFLSLESK